MNNANKWVVQSAPAPLPPGVYRTTFSGVSDFALPATGEPRWRWVWRVTAGPQQGQDATTLTEMRLTATSAAGRLVAGLLGRELVPGDDVEALIAQCQGARYLVTVAAGPQGGKPAFIFVCADDLG